MSSAGVILPVLVCMTGGVSDCQHNLAACAVVQGRVSLLRGVPGKVHVRLWKLSTFVRLLLLAGMLAWRSAVVLNAASCLPAVTRSFYGVQ